eukprot:364796-Chlamydomonas_euryale.AAC.9
MDSRRLELGSLARAWLPGWGFDSQRLELGSLRLELLLPEARAWLLAYHEAERVGKISLAECVQAIDVGFGPPAGGPRPSGDPSRMKSCARPVGDWPSPGLVGMRWDDVDTVQHGSRAHAAWPPQCRHKAHDKATAHPYLYPRRAARRATVAGSAACHVMVAESTTHTRPHPGPSTLYPRPGRDLNALPETSGLMNQQLQPLVSAHNAYLCQVPGIGRRPDGTLHPTAKNSAAVGVPQLMRILNAAKLTCLGHVAGMPDGSVVQLLLFAEGLVDRVEWPPRPTWQDKAVAALNPFLMFGRVGLV